MSGESRRESIRVAILQSRREKTWNYTLKRILSMLSKSSINADILLLGENWLSRDPIDIADYEYSLEKIAGEFSGTILGGSNYIFIDKNIIKSIGLFYNKNIKILCEKLFPSKAVGERGRIVPGRLLPPIDIEGWKVQCIVCVDIFYPEISRIATLLGADIIYNPASIPSDRTELWHSVLLTRAAENTVFVVGVNGVGYVYPDGRITLGSSIVYASNGVMLGKMGSTESVETYILDRRVTERIRARWAFYDDLTSVLASRIYGSNASHLIGKVLADNYH